MVNLQLKSLKKFMDNNLFSDDLAFSLSRFSSYEKGKEYFEDGQVDKIWQEENGYKSIVKGTHNYNVSLKFNDEEVLEYNCSCPYELDGACKHVVATIFAFASDKNFINKSSPKKINKENLDLEKLLEKTNIHQLKLFLKKIFIKQPQLIEDFNIFLQGSKQTPVTTNDYKTRFRNELDELDLEELLQVWYFEGGDYYDSDQYNDFDTSLSLSDVVENMTDLGKKYEDSENFGEALKIYQAIFEALDEKHNSLKGDDLELQDCFREELEKIVNDFYIKTLTKINNDNLKKIGVEYLCYLFQYDYNKFSSNQNNILLGLKQIILNKNEAENALSKLDKLKNKGDSTIPESLLLAFLYSMIEDWQLFEKISLKNLDKNPSLTLNLLRYYQKNNDKEKIIKIAEQILAGLMKKNDSNNFSFEFNQKDTKEIEIEIRRFLKEIYSFQTEYEDAISNLERLFLITGSLLDYQELIKKYKNVPEKIKYWETMIKYFSDKNQVKNIYKVFKLENQKEKILDLIKKYPTEESFPDMITFIQSDFPQECFMEYRKKVEEILKETNTEKYPVAVYHLKRMEKIGLDKVFADFIIYLKDIFKRRSSLMRELQENQL